MLSVALPQPHNRAGACIRVTASAVCCRRISFTVSGDTHAALGAPLPSTTPSARTTHALSAVVPTSIASTLELVDPPRAVAAVVRRARGRMERRNPHPQATWGVSGFRGLPTGQRMCVVGRPSVSVG
jgi:hypothetical protein